MMKCTKIGIAIMLALMLICVVLPTNALAETGMNRCTNEVYNYSVEYPKGWEKQEVSFVIFRGPMKNGFYINVNIVVEELLSTMGLEEYASIGEKQLEAAFQNYHKEREYSSTINGEPCIIREHTCTYQGTDMKQKQVYLINDNKAYVITCSSTPSTYYNDNEYYFKPIIQSFKFTKEYEEDKGFSWIWLVAIGTIGIIFVVIIGVIVWKAKQRKRIDELRQYLDEQLRRKVITPQIYEMYRKKYNIQSHYSPQPGYRPPPKTSGFAIASLVTGLVGLIIVGVILGILAIVFGAVAMSRINDKPRILNGYNMAIAGLVLGIIDIIGAILVLIYFSSVWLLPGV